MTVLVHVGQTPPSLEGLLLLMTSGDILTHSFRGGEHSILGPSGKIREDVLEAKARGAYRARNFANVLSKFLTIGMKL